VKIHLCVLKSKKIESQKMKKELIISCEDEASKIALIEDGRLFELHVEEQSSDYVVGDIFVGKVKKLAPNLNAAFVNIGYDKDAFLHYQDLGPEFRTYQNLLKGILHKKIQTSRQSLYFLFLF